MQLLLFRKHGALVQLNPHPLSNELQFNSANESRNPDQVAGRVCQSLHPIAPLVEIHDPACVSNHMWLWKLSNYD
uniref:Uncharacterized protein n=1 Tax=Romanomermis culicivorax TaxID=13658 RepID=A0A915LAD4_ROMCU